MIMVEQATPSADSNGADDPSPNANMTSDDRVSRPAILRLPRELRDLIYGYYVQAQGGYVHNFVSNKLRQADGRPICYSLALACRQTACELRGLGLGLNTITFTTHCSESTRTDAALFHAALRNITYKKRILVERLSAHLLTQDMGQAAMDLYPQFSPIFEDWTPGRNITAYTQPAFIGGEASSLWHDLSHHLLHSMSKHPRFLEVAKTTPRLWASPDECNALELSNNHPEPWSIPCHTELDRLAKMGKIEPKWPACPTQTNFSYSAVSVSLRFLHSIPGTTRHLLRKITLVDDREAAARSECHGRGMISMCKAHPKLRVERIVNLWKNAFPVAGHAKNNYVVASEFHWGIDRVKSDRLVSARVTKAIGIWIMEALALSSLGMPKKSYSLIFDGNPIPAEASKVFRVVQRDAAWQSALDAAYAGGMLPKHSWLARRLRTGYMYEGLPDAIRNLSMGVGSVRCNFNLGQQYDVDSLLEEHRGWTLREWSNNWNTHQPENFQTKPPLPLWHVLRWQYVLPQTPD